MQEDVHGGHRERLVNKFIEFPQSFSDHELLELFLFRSLPRKDTNAIAHRLISSFGSIKKVFEASAEQLLEVRGVGKKTAAELVLFGKLLRKVAEKTDKTVFNPLRSYEQTVNGISAYFEGLRTEKFYLFLLDRTYSVVFTMEYCDADEDSVLTDATEIARAIALHKAKFAIIAHNHPSGNEKPSKNDDLATRKFYMLCKLHGIQLIDHVIFSKTNVYSYFREGSLEFIKETVDF